MPRTFLRFLFSVAIIAVAALPAQAAGPFADWAAIVIAGDWHAHDGSPSEIFDNSRHDVTADLLALGFSRDNIQQFSVRPERYSADAPLAAEPQSISNTLWDLSNRTTGGCLVYVSSHGSPDGAVLGEGTLSPELLGKMLNNSCADRPTVVIISACFSGVFVKPLAAPNRMILTAARPDRTSFGCGATNKYPYFDECILSVWNTAGDFPSLGKRAQECVASREKKEHLAPPSEPQLWVGTAAAGDLPVWDAAKVAAADATELKPPGTDGAGHGRRGRTPP